MTITEYNESVKRYADDVYRFVLKNISRKDDANDIVQSTFETVWMKREEIEFEKVKSFLFTVAYRRLIDQLRMSKRIQYHETIADHHGGYIEIHEQGVKKELHRVLETLPEIQKQLVLLKDYEGCSYEELAQITNLSVNQVKVYLHRARTSLKKSLVSVEHTLL
jgi:RNA polymerase sigma factor (sigma-70 family)